MLTQKIPLRNGWLPPLLQVGSSSHTVGEELGSDDGGSLGSEVGTSLGDIDGKLLGASEIVLGRFEGESEGSKLGTSEGGKLGNILGTSEGCLEGKSDGIIEGVFDNEGALVVVGKTVGSNDGSSDGIILGSLLGAELNDGSMLGDSEGVEVGLSVGNGDGIGDGGLVGSSVGVEDGSRDGTLDGLSLGSGVGEGVGCEVVGYADTDGAVLGAFGHDRHVTGQLILLFPHPHLMAVFFAATQSHVLNFPVFGFARYSPVVSSQINVGFPDGITDGTIDIVGAALGAMHSPHVTGQLSKTSTLFAHLLEVLLFAAQAQSLFFPNLDT